MWTRRAVISCSALLGLAVVLSGLAVAWTMLSRADISVRYRFDAGSWMQGTLPLEIAAERDVVQLEVSLHTTSPVSKWKLLSSGCILDLHLNGERMHIDGEQCGNVHVNFSDLREGNNELVLSLRSGSPLRFDLVPSVLDPILLALEILAFVALAITLFLLRSFLYPDKTGTIFVWTFLLGVMLRAGITETDVQTMLPPLAAFLLSCAALALLHVTAFHLRAERGRTYLWCAGLLSAALPLLSPGDVVMDLLVVAITGCLILWWEHPRSAMWFALLLLLTAGVQLDAAFLGLWAVALLCLFRQPTLKPRTLLALFLLSCILFIAVLSLLQPLPWPTAAMLREAVSKGLPFTPHWPFMLLVLLSIPSCLSMRQDGLRAMRILLLLGGVTCSLLIWLYGHTMQSTVILLLPACVLLASDAISKVVRRVAA